MKDIERDVQVSAVIWDTNRSWSLSVGNSLLYSEMFHIIR